MLIPMTSPATFTSGPPELPKLIAASVWIRFSNERVAFERPGAAPLAGDDADGDRLLELERVADRHDPLADADAVGVAERHDREGLRPLDLQEREVRRRVAADDLRLVDVRLADRHLDLRRRPSMTWLFVRTKPSGLDEEAGPARLLLLLLLLGPRPAGGRGRRRSGTALPSPKKRSMPPRAGSGLMMSVERDRDDGRHHLFGDVREGRQPGHGRTGARRSRGGGRGRPPRTGRPRRSA